MHDILSNLKERRITCLDKGFVEIIDMMPRLAAMPETTADFAVPEAARNSYADAAKRSSDRDLIRYMMRHDHGTPFEVVIFQFNVKIPLIIAKQWQRHRISSYNELSGRYSEMKEEFYVPSQFRLQDPANKQGSDGILAKQSNEEFVHHSKINAEFCHDHYRMKLKAGIAKEQARFDLPLSTYTNFYWTTNFRSLMNFIGLRSDSRAQKEIRDYSDAILSLIRPLIPECVEAFEDYHPKRGAVLLTRLEAEALRSLMAQMSSPCIPPIASQNKREQAEWQEKARKLGLS